MALPRAEVLFGDHSADVLTEKMDKFLETTGADEGRFISKAEWQVGSPERSGTPIVTGPASQSRPANTPLEMLQKALLAPEITKSMAPDQLQALGSLLESQKAEIPDLVKDLTTSSPLASGLVVFDLESGAKMLTPKPTPLRNRIPRGQGFGLAHRYKRITGFTGTGTGVGVVRPGIQDSTQTNFAAQGSANGLYFNRGGKISYAGDEAVVPYIQFGVSDEVNWSAQYTSRGFQDLRALSRATLTYSSMLLEERVMLYGRGTASGFSGVLAAPTGVAMTARASTGSEVGLSGITTNVYAFVVAENGDWGVSQASAVANVAATNGQVIDITYTLPTGATGARVFLGTGAAQPANSAFRLYVNDGSRTSPTTGGRSGYNKLTAQGALPTTTIQITAWPLTTPGNPTVDLTAVDGGSAYVNEYDGLLSYCTGATAGYVNRINGLFSNSNPGAEFQDAFARLWETVKASPDRIMMAGIDRKQLSDTIKGQPNSNYGIRLMRDDINGVTLGSVAASVINEVAQDNKEVQIEVHPWMPQGVAPIVSDTLPIPDSGVDSCFKAFNVQDLMGIDWPVNQFTFDASSYWFGTMVCYAPAWQGAITGIQRA